MENPQNMVDNYKSARKEISEVSQLVHKFKNDLSTTDKNDTHTRISELLLKIAQFLKVAKETYEELKSSNEDAKSKQSEIIFGFSREMVKLRDQVQALEDVKSEKTLALGEAERKYEVLQKEMEEYKRKTQKKLESNSKDIQRYFAEKQKLEDKYDSIEQQFREFKQENDKKFESLTQTIEWLQQNMIVLNIGQLSSTVFRTLPRFLLLEQNTENPKEDWDLFQTKNFDDPDTFNLNNVQVLKEKLKAKDNNQLKDALKDLDDQIFKIPQMRTPIAHPTPTYTSESLKKLVGSDLLINVDFLLTFK